MTKTDINERFICAIKKLLDKDKKLTKSKIADALDIKPSKFSEILNNRMKAGVDIIALLCQKYDLSAEWLLTGRGEMEKTKRIPNPPSVATVQPYRCKDTTINQNKQEKEAPIAHQTHIPGEGIPLIPFEAMAGALTSEQSVLEYECERYIVPAFTGADFLIPVKGDSMSPTYKSGDLVACKRVPMSERFFQWNKAYVIDTNQGPLIKRIKPAGEGHLFLISDNEDYDPIELPATAIYAVALVIGIIRLE